MTVDLGEDRRPRRRRVRRQERVIEGVRATDERRRSVADGVRCGAAMRGMVSGVPFWRGLTRALCWGTLSIVAGAAIAEAAPAQSEAPPTAVILISLDGTRPADVTPTRMPTLAAFAEWGAAADGLRPVSPSNTFPSHVSLATGVAPDRHGIVNNTFEDAERGVFKKKDPDIPSWIQVEPIWSLLERANVRTASFYWVGSEGDWPGGRGPSEWKKFSSRTSEKTKVDQILEWVDLPDAERPRLITAWFHGGDGPGHREGPGAEAVGKALAKQDVQIGRLVRGLAERGRLADTTLIFVSDHGMASAEVEVDLAAALKKQDGVSARVYGIGGFASVVLRGTDAGAGQGFDDAIDLVVARARALGLEAHARPDAPTSWRVDNPRFGDVVVRAPIGTAIVYRGLDIAGFHGYDPDAPEMAALFFALGRGVQPGTKLEKPSSTDVAPTVLALLGQPIPEWMEGAVIEAIVPGTGASATLAPGDDAQAHQQAAPEEAPESPR